MRKSGQNTVAVLALILAIAVTLAFIAKASRPKRHPRPVVDWICEEYDHRFVAGHQRDPRVCPECRGEAVRTLYYYCSVHDHLFEAYRSKPDPDVEPGQASGIGMGTGLLYKFPGGEWTREYPMGITCPAGNSDSGTIKYSPPEAEERQEKTE